MHGSLVVPPRRSKRRLGLWLVIYGVGAARDYVRDVGVVTAAYTSVAPSHRLSLYVCGSCELLVPSALSVPHESSCRCAPPPGMWLLYRCCARKGRPLARCSRADAGLSPSFWARRTSRVCAHAVFVVLATSAALAWRRDSDDRHLVLAFFWCALGATNHTFMGIYAVVLGVYAITAMPALLLRVGTMVRIALATVVGLLPYAYLPIRSRMNPRLDWGNPETLEGFLGVVLRRDFGSG